VRVLFVGNDVVDLDEPRTAGRSTDERFVARVFGPDERAAILAATDGDLELWARWAAKETAFKVVSKLIGTPPPFAHRAFKVEWTDSTDSTTSAEGTIREGRVTYEGHEVRVAVLLGERNVHAVGFGSPGGPPERAALLPRCALLEGPDASWAGPMEALEARFTDRERDAVRSRQSAAVRLGARADLARVLGVGEDRLEIVCDAGPTSRRPPRVLLDGHRVGADLSLSHDGRWIAWVIWMDDEAEEK